MTLIYVLQLPTLSKCFVGVHAVIVIVDAKLEIQASSQTVNFLCGQLRSRRVMGDSNRFFSEPTVQ